MRVFIGGNVLYYFLSFVIGSTVGFFSYRAEKMFVALVAACTPVVMLISFRVLAPFLSFASDIPADRPGDETGEQTILSVMLDVPEEFKLALMLFPIFLIGARIVTWFCSIAFEKEEIPETRAERRRRIRASYGMED